MDAGGLATIENEASDSLLSTAKWVSITNWLSGRRSRRAGASATRPNACGRPAKITRNASRHQELTHL